MAVEIQRVIMSERVSGVTSTQLTPVEQDPSTGHYVRQLRLFGLIRDSDGQASLVATVEIRSATREGVELSTPPLTF